jgi:hypothetical protein
MEWLLQLLLVVLLALSLWRRWWLWSVVSGHAVLLGFGWLAHTPAGVFVAIVACTTFWGSLAMFAPFLLPLRNWKSDWWLAVGALWGFVLDRTRPYYGMKGNDLVEHKKGRLLNRYTGPGIILLTGNHAVALSKGINYTRVDGPGLVFTHRKERPLQLVDLRPQIRPNHVDATTQDGIRVKTRVFVASRVKGSGKPGGKWGEFPYNISESDVFQAIRSAEVYTDRSEPIDEVISNKAIALVRDELSTFRLDRLWGFDAQGRDPQARLQERIQSKLKEFADRRGIELLGAGLNPIQAPDKIIEQRVLSWQAMWREQMMRTRSEGEADALREMGRARAQAQRDLITGILTGLDKTGVSNNVDSSDVIAYQFITALERAIQDPNVRDYVSPETEQTVDSLRRKMEQIR